MKVRLGYVAISLEAHKGSPNKTITYKSYSKLSDDEVKLYKLKSLTEENLTTTKRILIHNTVRDICVYRLTSSLVPLVNHPEVIKWDYGKEFAHILNDIGKYIKENKIRISTHPDHFTLINSPREEVLLASLMDLNHHVTLFKGMNLDPAYSKMVLHVGGLYNDKKSSMNRFIKNFNQLEPDISNRIILENDDKIYGSQDVLELCKVLHIPMVLDIHHHWCNNSGESIQDILGDVFSTWSHEMLPPKIHVSSPKCNKNPRAHADLVDPDFFFEFLLQAKKIDMDFDVMIEAKLKDKALIKLMEDLSKYKEIKIKNGASFEM